MEVRYKLLGDLILVKHPISEEQARDLLSRFPRCKSVIQIESIQGQLRIPKIKIIWGDSTQTIHREHGCLFKLDLSKVMFSLGNQGERIRLARLVRSNEHVLDMFSGIGYFCIPIGVHSRPRKIIAIELNPDAYELLLENIRLNGLEGIIHPILGDCGEWAPRFRVDRVIMGSFDANRYLSEAIMALNPGGMLHYHRKLPENQIDQVALEVEEKAEHLGRRSRLKLIRVVKKYAPRIVHVAADFQIW